MKVVTGIVLSTFPVAERHCLLELFTPQGRQKAMVFGARNSRQRYQGALQLFTTLTVQLTQKPGRQEPNLIVKDAQIDNVRLGLRQELIRLQRAGQLCQFVSRLFPIGEATPEAFALLAEALDAVAIGKFYPESTLIYFKWLQLAGVSTEPLCYQQDCSLAKQELLIQHAEELLVEFVTSA